MVPDVGASMKYHDSRLPRARRFVLEGICGLVVGVHLNAQVFIGLGQRQGEREKFILRKPKLALEERKHLVQAAAFPLAVEYLVRDALAAIQRVQMADAVAFDASVTADFGATPDGVVSDAFQNEHNEVVL